VEEDNSSSSSAAEEEESALEEEEVASGIGPLGEAEYRVAEALTAAARLVCGMRA
jgi:hypothetical protein